MSAPADVAPKTPPADAKIELTQERLDQLIDKAFARGAKNSNDAKAVAKMQEELDELRGLKAWLEEEAKKKTPAAEGGDSDAEARYQQKLNEIKLEYERRVEKLETDQTTKLGELEARVAALRSDGLKSRVVTDIAGIAADPEEVFTLMQAKGYFRQDEESGDYVVIDPVTKKVRLDIDADGEPLSPGKAAVEWLDQHPRHKRASGRTGSGQGSGDSADGEAPSSTIDTTGMKSSAIFAKRHEIIAGLRNRG